MASTKKQLVVFDFDWSMADQDTDRWVFEVLAIDLRRKLRDRQRGPSATIYWTDLVAECLRQLSEKERCITREDIENALRQMPFHPAMKRGIKLLKEPTSLDTTIFILSNANTFYIDTIVCHQGIRDCFETITSNPADFSDPDLPNRLILRRRVSPDGPQHGCQVGCEPNMCKGKELTQYIADHSAFDRTIYIGDGANDFCAVLRLRSQDVVLCRRFRGLERKIAEERAKGTESRLRCIIEYWSGAWEVEEKFKVYAQRASLGDVN